MKRVAIYMRVSTDRQAQEGDSIQAQRDALRKYVDSHEDMTLVGEYIDDGISGRKFQQRDELQRLLSSVKENQIDIIAFTKLDRWFRSIRHYTATQEVLDKHNVSWLAIWEPIYDTTTPSGRLIVNQMMSIAQFEAENTGTRIQQVFEYKVRQGEVISGSVPVGYKIVNKHLVPDENADAIKEAFEHYARYGNLNETVRLLAEKYGLRREKHVLKNSILKNTKYIGEFRGNTSYCKPIISRELFGEVQRKLSMNISQSQKHTYIFAGMIKCGECGRRFAGFRPSQRLKTGKKVYPAYRCPGHYVRAENTDCPNTKAISESALEKYLLENVRGELEDIVFHAKEAQAESKDDSIRIATLERKISKLKDLYINDLISLDEYKADKESYQKEIEALQAAVKPIQRDLTAINKFLQSGFENVYNSLTKEEKRYMWRSIIKEIRYDNDKNLEFIFL